MDMERFVLVSGTAADSPMNPDNSGVKLIHSNPEEVRERNGRTTARKKGNQNRVHDLAKPDKPAGWLVEFSCHRALRASAIPHAKPPERVDMSSAVTVRAVWLWPEKPGIAGL